MVIRRRASPHPVDAELVETLRDRNKNLRETIDRLRPQRDRLQAEVVRLQGEVRRLRTEQQETPAAPQRVSPLSHISAVRTAALTGLEEGNLEAALDGFSQLASFHWASERATAGLREVARLAEANNDEEKEQAALERLADIRRIQAYQLWRLIWFYGRDDLGPKARDLLKSVLVWNPEMARHFFIDGWYNEVSRDFIAPLSEACKDAAELYPNDPLLLKRLVVTTEATEPGIAHELRSKIASLVRSSSDRSSSISLSERPHRTVQAALLVGERTIARSWYESLLSDALAHPSAKLLTALYWMFPVLGSKEEMSAIAHPIVDGDHDPATTLAAARLLVTVGDGAKALTVVDHLAEQGIDLATTRDGALLATWAAAVRGDFALAHHLHAKTTWPATQQWYAALGSDTLKYLSFVDRSALPAERLPDDAIPLVATLRDELPRLPAFLDHYRHLGVTHFLLVDNASTDGSADYLQSQPDVMLFHASEGIARSHYGVRWLNYLIDLYTPDHWCLSADLDEHLVFRGSEQPNSLPPLIAKLENEGASMLGSFMLDMYPAHGRDIRNPRSAEDLRATHRYFDNNYVSVGHLEAPYASRLGGVRTRVGSIESHPDLAKTPLFATGRRMRHNCVTHTMPPGPVAREGGVLLHYKFASNAEQRTQLATHSVSDNWAHRGATNDELLGPDSVIFESSEQLADLGLLDHSISIYWDDSGRNESTGNDVDER